MIALAGMVSFKSILFAAVAGVALSTGAEAHNGVVHGRERRPRGDRPAVRPSHICLTS